jgi:hypothetical protein
MTHGARPDSSWRVRKRCLGEVNLGGGCPPAPFVGKGRKKEKWKVWTTMSCSSGKTSCNFTIKVTALFR